MLHMIVAAALCGLLSGRLLRNGVGGMLAALLVAFVGAVALSALREAEPLVAVAAFMLASWIGSLGVLVGQAVLRTD